MIYFVDHPTCPATAQDQCSRCHRVKGRAMTRMLMMGTVMVDRRDDPVGWADAQTSMHDARIALNIARGVPLSEITPGMGYSTGDRR